MRFTDIFIRRPILAVVVSLLILLVGGASMALLNVREYPNMESATITVTTSYPGATQEVMQGFVTTPIAQAIATANGIEYLTSSSTQSMSTVSAKLKLNANADRSMTEILARVQQVKYQLPPGATDPIIAKITDGVAAIEYVTFQSDTMSIPQLTDFAISRPVLTLDLTDVERIDFVAAGALLNAINRIEGQRKAVQIAGASAIIRALLLLIGISPRHFIRKT